MGTIKPDHRSLFIATVASAVLGSALIILIAFDWPRWAIDWMRVIVSQSVPPPAARIAASFIGLTLVLAVAILVARWILQRLRMTNPAVALIALFIAVFAAAFTFEAVTQKMNAAGNLTAQDATGYIIYDMEMTAHGWETVARRALAASVYVSLIAAAFWTVSSALMSRRRNT
jgi:uncharacterized protein YacL